MNFFHLNFFILDKMSSLKAIALLLTINSVLCDFS